MKKKKLKKIAILLENLLYGGVTTHLNNLINDKKFRDFEITVITNKSNNLIQDIAKNSKYKNIKIIQFFSLNNFILRHKYQKIIFHSLRPILFVISIFQMINIFKKNKFDIILANCGGFGDFRSEISGVFAAKFLKNENINLLIHHNYTKPKYWHFFLKIIEFFLSKCINKFIFVSNATKKSILHNTNFSKLHPKKITVIHNGVLIKKVLSKKLFNLNLSPKINKIGMLSRIEEYKGQQDLVEGFSRLNSKEKIKFRVFFIGTGSKLQEKALKKKINFYNLGQYIKIYKRMNQDSYSILKNFDMYFSLTRDFEGFGYSIAEALYAGVPVVSTNVGGTTEFLNKNNSELIKPRSIKVITKLLSDFLKNKKKWKKKAVNGRKTIIKKFNSNLMAEKFYKVLINDK